MPPTIVKHISPIAEKNFFLNSILDEFNKRCITSSIHKGAVKVCLISVEWFRLRSWFLLQVKIAVRILYIDYLGKKGGTYYIYFEREFLSLLNFFLSILGVADLKRYQILSLPFTSLNCKLLLLGIQS